MASLKGFPASNTISPSVRIAEKDLSFIAPEQNFSRAGMVGFANKGPINVPTLVTSARQLHTLFGLPQADDGDPYLLYAAEQYLAVANELYVVRVSDNRLGSEYAAETASVIVPGAGAQVTVTSAIAGPYVVAATSRNVRLRVNGVLMSKTLTAALGAGGATKSYTASELATELNSQLDAKIDGVTFFDSASSIAARATNGFGPQGSIEFVSVENPLVGPTVASVITPVVQLATASTTAKITAEGPFDFSSVPDDTAVTLTVVVDGSGNAGVDNVAQTITFDISGADDIAEATSAEVAAAINTALPKGFKAVDATGDLVLHTTHAGRDAKITVKPDGAFYASAGFYVAYDAGEEGGATVLGLGAGVTGNGTSTEGTTSAAGIVTGAEASNFSFRLNADSPGTAGNKTEVVIRNDPAEGTFGLDVYHEGNSVESWAGLSKEESDRRYVETFLDLVSDYIRCEDNTAVGALPKEGTYALANGSDGLPRLQDGITIDPDAADLLLVGSSAAGTGLYALSDPEQFDIDLIAVPGHSSTNVAVALLALAQDRGDCLAIIDPPFGLTVREITHWQNGSHPLNSVRFDSDFGALFWPWVLIRDTHNQLDVYVPPSGPVMATMARSDSLGGPWLAPAGNQRGVVPNVGGVYQRPTQAERDQMYGSRNCINPLVQFPGGQGIVLWGQKTLQRRPTALDRINVRRMLFYVEKRIKADVRNILFDSHDDQFRGRFEQIAESVLREVQVGRGLTDYRIDVGEELNTPDVIDRNEFRARIGLIPARAVEFVFIEFSVHRTGSFESSGSF